MEQQNIWIRRQNTKIGYSLSCFHNRQGFFQALWCMTVFLHGTLLLGIRWSKLLDLFCNFYQVESKKSMFSNAVLDRRTVKTTSANVGNRNVILIYILSMNFPKLYHFIFSPSVILNKNFWKSGLKLDLKIEFLGLFVRSMMVLRWTSGRTVSSRLHVNCIVC